MAAMKIYTKTGDRGDTGLLGGKRVPKDDPRVEAYGTLDELAAALGVVRAFLPAELASTHEVLIHIQRVLFDLGADLATPPGSRRVHREFAPAEIDHLERAIDAMETELEPVRQFILPGGHPAGALLHLARAVARRAERAAVTLAAGSEVEPQILAYLNRLSDFLFVVSRFVNARLGALEELVRDGADPGSQAPASR